MFHPKIPDMESINLNPLPEWNDERFDTIEDHASPEFAASVEAARDLYNQWREVFGLVLAFVASLDENEEDTEITRRSIFENAFLIPVKIRSAAGDTLYQIKMENAAIIRYNGRKLLEQIGFAAYSGNADVAYKEIIEAAMDKFKALFYRWVRTFEKDGFSDDWGLFGLPDTGDEKLEE